MLIIVTLLLWASKLRGDCSGLYLQKLSAKVVKEGKVDGSIYQILTRRKIKSRVLRADRVRLLPETGIF